jgi:acyl-CoA synthetase (AMP-forming)/AMP-acid ligase II
MQAVMNLQLRCGATVITMPRFDLEQFLELVERHRVTRAYLVPPIILALAKHPVVERFDLSRLRLICSAASPLAPELAHLCERRLGCEVREGYGLTEASPATHITPDGVKRRPGSVGLLLPNTECCVVDMESGSKLDCGKAGEIWVRGPQVMKGYLNNPEATADSVDREGWLHTGDIGYVDAEGYLFLLDRAKELIKVKGYQVAPAELEAILLKHPAVADVAVIRSSDGQGGEVPKAFVVASEKVSSGSLMNYLSDQVAPYKRVRKVEFVDEIPKSATGKILRRVLVERDSNSAR